MRIVEVSQNHANYNVSMVSELRVTFFGGFLGICFFLIFVGCGDSNDVPISITVEVTRVVEIENLVTVEVPVTVQVVESVEVIREVVVTSQPVPGSPFDWDFDFSGQYEGQGIADGSFCVVNAIHSNPTTSDPFDQLEFEIGCSSSGDMPSLGYLRETVRLVRGKAVYNSDYGDCSLIFEFSEDSVRVSQIGLGADCGFGVRVFADGVYPITNRKKPNMGCLSLYSSKPPPCYAE